VGRPKVRTPDGAESLADILGTQMDFLLPLFQAQDPNRDQLIADSGLSKAGFLQRAALEESLMLSRNFGGQRIREESRLRQLAIDANPLAKASQEASLESIGRRRDLSNQLLDQAEGGLEDLDGDGLPDDIQRNIEETSRASLAARGISESGAGGVLESLNLIGGREGLRQNRLMQAGAILSGAAPANTPGLGFAQPANAGLINQQSFFPGANALTGFAGTAFGAGAQNAGLEAQLGLQQQQMFMQAGASAGTAIAGGF
jgi:hypothetical protein